MVNSASRLLFVCLGNICRSPAAEGVCRARALGMGYADRLIIDSAGTSGWNAGRPPDRRTTAEARRRGIPMPRRRARQIHSTDFRSFELILGMDFANLAALEAMRPADATARLGLLLDFAPEVGRRDIPDPYHGGDAEFAAMFDLIEAGVAGLIAYLANNFPIRG